MIKRDEILSFLIERKDQLVKIGLFLLYETKELKIGILT